MSIRYAILCHARTGSNYLVNALAQHPDITGHNELFYEQRIYLASGTISDRHILTKRDANKIAFLNDTLNQASTPVRGFKHLLYYSAEITDYLINNEFHIILLERENILAQYSSLLIAEQTGQWTLRSSMKAPVIQKLMWDASDFDIHCQKYIKDYEQMKQMMKQRSYPILHIYYKDLFKQEDLSSVFEFLELKAGRPPDTATLRKQNNSHIIERFVTPDIVQQYLQKIGCPHWEFEAI